MKKSTLILTIAIVGLAATLMAANLKLKSEYSKGHIESAYKTSSLPVFHFISASFDSSSKYGGNFKINVGEKNNSQVAVFFSEEGDIKTIVRNDTLFISPRPQDKVSYSYDNEIIIGTKSLKGITANKGAYEIKTTTDSLSVYSPGEASFSLNTDNAGFLSLHIGGSSEVELSANKPVKHAFINIEGNGSFKANNVTILEKDLHFGPDARIQLTGRSLQDFGLTEVRKK